MSLLHSDRKRLLAATVIAVAFHAAALTLWHGVSRNAEPPASPRRAVQVTLSESAPSKSERSSTAAPQPAGSTRPAEPTRATGSNEPHTPPPPADERRPADEPPPDQAPSPQAGADDRSPVTAAPAERGTGGPTAGIRRLPEGVRARGEAAPAREGAETGPTTRARGAGREHDTPPAARRSVPRVEPVRYVAPEYPEAARLAGVSGRVVLRLAIGRRGRVEDVELIESSGHPLLDRAALRSVRLWRFPRDAAGRSSLHAFDFELES